jgi:WD40 repeat protein
MKHFFSNCLLAIVFVLLLATNRPPANPPAGQIAYIKGGVEIRILESNGSNDRSLWTHPDAKPELGIYDVAWKPDGKELAFTSSHASAYSIYHSDLYSIKTDGTGFRKITNAPDRSEFTKYPQGDVTVTFRNFQVTYQQSQASSGVFIVYIAGASKPQMITLPPGASKTITFKSVADFGKKAQAIVAIWGNYRWFMPGTDVEAGKNIKAPDFTISGNGFELFGTFRPVWRSDGSALSYRTGVCTVNRIPADPPVGEYYYQPMFGGKAPFGSCDLDWGPTPALADQIIYTENETEGSGIYQLKEGGTHPGKRLTAYSDIQYQILNDLHWLPDGSGLLYSTLNLFRDASNIFKFDFKTNQTTQVTKLEGAFTRRFTISPDGQWIVYERATTADEDKGVDLWMQKMDGSSGKLFVRNATGPAWRRD